MDDVILHKIAREAAREAVRETLTGLGFAVRDPQEMQADLLYLHRLRTGSEFMALRVKAALIAFMIPALLYMLWEAFKGALGK